MEQYESENTNIEWSQMSEHECLLPGSPAAALFMWHQATTTICHSRTKNIEEHCRRADVLIVAIGKKNFVKGEQPMKG